MLPSIKILSFDDATKALLSDASYTHVLSINDVGSSPPVPLDGYKTQKLILHFDDVVESWDKYIPPTQEQIADVLGFAETMNKESKVLVHCWAGISRSSACALAILASKIDNAYEVLTTLYKIKSTINPNALIVEHTDNLLGFQGDLFREFVRWPI